MRLAVLGGTGRTGVPLTLRALADGHHVKVLARDPGKAAELLGGYSVAIVAGDLLDPVAVAEVVEGTEAVVDVAGPVRGGPPDLRQRAIAHVLSAMHTHGVKRLVALTGAGVRVPGDAPKAVDKVFGVLLRRLQPQLLADSEAYVERVRASDVDWTVVRAPRLTDDQPRRTYRHAANVGSSTGIRIARADLVTFVLDELVTNRYVGHAPVVSW